MTAPVHPVFKDLTIIRDDGTAKRGDGSTAFSVRVGENGLAELWFHDRGGEPLVGITPVSDGHTRTLRTVAPQHDSRPRTITDICSER